MEYSEVSPEVLEYSIKKTLESVGGDPNKAIELVVIWLNAVGMESEVTMMYKGKFLTFLAKDIGVPTIADLYLRIKFNKK
jgi:hypothetical protein